MPAHPQGSLHPQLRFSLLTPNLSHSPNQSLLVSIPNCQAGSTFPWVWNVWQAGGSGISPGILPLQYLCSDSAGKAPHGFVRGVVLPPTPHLKGERDRVSFHLRIFTAGRGGKKKKINLITEGNKRAFHTNGFFYR